MQQFQYADTPLTRSVPEDKAEQYNEGQPKDDGQEGQQKASQTSPPCKPT
jgi:hypothetical protein